MAFSNIHQRKKAPRQFGRSCVLRGPCEGTASVHFRSLYTRCHLVTSADTGLRVSAEPNHTARIISITTCLLEINKWMSNNFLELNGGPKSGPACWPQNKESPEWDRTKLLALALATGGSHNNNEISSSTHICQNEIK